MLLPQVAHSELRGAHKLVEGIDALRQFLSHGCDYVSQVREACENDGALRGVSCARLLERDEGRAPFIVSKLLASLVQTYNY